MMCSNPKDLKPDDTPTADLGVVEVEQTDDMIESQQQEAEVEHQQQVDEAAKEDGE